MQTNMNKITSLICSLVIAAGLISFPSHIVYAQSRVGNADKEGINKKASTGNRSANPVNQKKTNTREKPASTPGTYRPTSVEKPKTNNAATNRKSENSSNQSPSTNIKSGNNTNINSGNTNVNINVDRSKEINVNNSRNTNVI